MKVLKENDNPHAKIIRGLEEYLRKNKVSIDYGYNGLQVTIENTMYHIKDVEQNGGVSILPRMFDSERFVLDSSL